MLQTAQTNSFNVVAVGTQLAFTQQPATAVAGEAVNPSVLVSVEDGFGNVDTSNASNVTVTLSGGPAHFFGGTTSETVTSINGVAAFNNLVVTAAGTYTLTAVDSNNSISSATSFSFTVGTHTLTSIDDNNANNTGGLPQVSYSVPANWVQTPTSAPNNFDGTVTTDSTGGDTASVTFNGTLITFYALTSPTAGSAKLFIDQNVPIDINLAAATTSVQPVFTSPLLSAGSHTILVKVNNGSVGIDRFVVGPATPTLVWATPTPITFDTPLNGTQLDAFVSNFASFPGTLTYTPTMGTILPVGNNQVLSVTFAPSDSTDYISSTAQVLINVVKATPTITWLGPNTDMTFGQVLGPDQLDATATINGTTVPGSFVYTPGAGTEPPTGANFDLSLTFTPDDTTDFNSTTANADVDVDPATPVITWANPADITDGTPLSSTQLDARATDPNNPANSLPGSFVYTPAAGTVLPPGQGEQLGVVFSPQDGDDYNVVGTTALINVNYGAPSQLAFGQQPSNALAGSSNTPPIIVDVEDSTGATIAGNNTKVTLTLSSGTFDGGSTTISAVAVNGQATFGDMVIDATGTYTISASAAGVTGANSNSFLIYTPLSLNLNFNNASTDFTNNFTVNVALAHANNGNPNSITWGSNFGINDNTGGTVDGGIQSSNFVTVNNHTTSSTIDWTMDYAPTSGPSTVNLADGQVHTLSEFYNVSTYTGIGSGDKSIQLGLLGPGSTEFNSSTSTVLESFISARVLGDKSVEFQSENNIANQGAASIDNTGAVSGVAAGDWVQPSSMPSKPHPAASRAISEEIDYGPTGTAAGTVVLSPVSWSVSGITGFGTGTAVTPGWREAITGSGYRGHIEYDNFQLDQPGAPSKPIYLQAPISQTAGIVMPKFVIAIVDANGRTITTDNSSTVTVALTHGTFSTGATQVTATPVNGIVTLTGLMINVPGGYSLRAQDSLATDDVAFAPVNITGGSQLTFAQQPTNANAGATLPSVVVDVQDDTGTTVPTDTSNVTLTLSSGTFVGGSTTKTVANVNGVATFNNLAVCRRWHLHHDGLRQWLLGHPTFILVRHSAQRYHTCWRRAQSLKCLSAAYFHCNNQRPAKWRDDNAERYLQRRNHRRGHRDA